MTKPQAECADWALGAMVMLPDDERVELWDAYYDDDRLPKIEFRWSKRVGEKRDFVLNLENVPTSIVADFQYRVGTQWPQTGCDSDWDSALAKAANDRVGENLHDKIEKATGVNSQSGMEVHRD